MAGNARDAEDLSNLQSARAGRYGPMLDDEAKNARNSSQALSEFQGSVDMSAILVAIDRVEALLGEQTERDERMGRRLDQITMRMQKALTKAEKVQQEALDSKAMMQDAVSSGFMEAHSVATEHALQEITQVADGAKKQLKALEDESRERAERLRKITMPSRVLAALKGFLFFVCGVLTGWAISFFA